MPLLFALALAAPATAQTNLTGSWSGNYAYSVQLTACQNKTFTSSGNVTINFLQTGVALQGRADFADALIFSGNCNPVKGEETDIVYGTLDGSHIVWALTNDATNTQFNGTVTGDSITAQFSDAAGGTGTLSLTRPPADPMAVDVTGSWSGNYNFVDRCANGGTQAYTGALTLGVTQTGGRVGGVATLQNVPLYDSRCRKIATLNQTMSFSGAVASSTLTGAVFDPSGSFDFPISATISGSSMSGTVSGANQTSTTGTFTLNHSSTASPAADFAGNYTGTYSEQDDETQVCANISALRFNGPATLSIAQAGNSVSGALIFKQALDVQSDGFGGCIPVNIGDEVLPFYGQLTNNVLNTVLPIGPTSALFNVTFAGNAVQGSISDSFGDAAIFSLTKVATPAPPGPRRHVVRP